MMGSRGFILKGLILLLVMALLLAACQRLNPSPQAQVSTETAVLPDTGGPLVKVDNQESDGSQVKVKRVVSEGPGWVAIHTVVDGRMSADTIGHEHVDAGESLDVVVTLEPGKATQEMVAMLHVDDGQEGAYEFPGVDKPADPPPGSEKEQVQPHFRITPPQEGAAAPASGTPILEVTDQPIENNIVIISRLVSSKDVWVAILDDHGGKPGDVVGQTKVRAGDPPRVEVTIDSTHPKSASLYAALYEDADQDDRLERPTDEDPDAPDIPVTVNGEPVQKAFTHQGMEVAQGASPAPGTAESSSATPQATDVHGHTETTSTPAAAPVSVSPCFAPATASEGVNPGIQVSDQEITDGAIHITSVVSADPGWVTIWTLPENGAPEAIGSQAIQAGETLDLSVPVEAGKATARMSAVLHLDGGQPGIFEPDKDCIAEVALRRVVTDFNATGLPQGAQPAESELRVIVDDQPLRGGDTLIIAEVVSDGPGWIGIHITLPDGTMSHEAAIGAGHLNDGLNINVPVRITNPARVTDKLWGMLHHDREPIGEYEFPGGNANDVPAEDANGNQVVDDFLVTGGKAGQPVVLKVATVKDSSGREATILVDGQGFSLYTPNSGDCLDAECLKVWRPLLSTGSLEPGDGVTGLVSVRPLGDGNRQVTYGGLPLYYYVGDAFDGDVKPGDTNGHLKEGRWVLVQP